LSHLLLVDPNTTPTSKAACLQASSRLMSCSRRTWTNGPSYSRPRECQNSRHLYPAVYPKKNKNHAIGNLPRPNGVALLRFSASAAPYPLLEQRFMLSGCSLLSRCSRSSSFVPAHSAFSSTVVF
jgi:hypothetical protein